MLKSCPHSCRKFCHSCSENEEEWSIKPEHQGDGDFSDELLQPFYELSLQLAAIELIELFQIGSCIA
jgi:hypothetical protein